MNNETINYLTLDQAQYLVGRIQKRCLNFDYGMTSNEAQAMAELLSEIGVKTSDLIDVSNLADNYAINAEIVTPDEVDDYSRSSLRDALFTWNENNGDAYYCLSW